MSVRSIREAIQVAAAALLACLLLAHPVLAQADGANSEATPEAEPETRSTIDPAADEDPTSEVEPASALTSRTMDIVNKSFDVVVLRPVSFLMTGVGACLFPPAALLASPGGMEPIEEALDRFVLIPWEYAAMRPLGEF